MSPAELAGARGGWADRDTIAAASGESFRPGPEGKRRSESSPAAATSRAEVAGLVWPQPVPRRPQATNSHEVAAPAARDCRREDGEGGMAVDLLDRGRQPRDRWNGIAPPRRARDIGQIAPVGRVQFGVLYPTTRLDRRSLRRSDHPDSPTSPVSQESEPVRKRGGKKKKGPAITAMAGPVGLMSWTGRDRPGRRRSGGQLASAVTPLKSSVRNGVSGSPRPEYMLHFGLSAQP